MRELVLILTTPSVRVGFILVHVWGQALDALLETFTLNRYHLGEERFGAL